MFVLLGARQNDTNVPDLNMRPKRHISTSVMAKIGVPNIKEFRTKTDKNDRNAYVTRQFKFEYNTKVLYLVSSTLRSNGRNRSHKMTSLFVCDSGQTWNQI